MQQFQYFVSIEILLGITLNNALSLLLFFLESYQHKTKLSDLAKKWVSWHKIGQIRVLLRTDFKTFCLGEY